MNWLVSLVFLVLAPAFAIFIGCLGVEMIGENPFGWLLFPIGVGYPPWAILYDRRQREQINRSR
jgi:hypothetical protein